MQVKENVNVSNFLLIGSPAGNGNNIPKADKKNEQSDFTSFLISAGSQKAEPDDMNIVKDTKKKEFVDDLSITNSADNLKDAESTKQAELSADNRSADGEDDLKSADIVENSDDTKQTDAAQTDSLLLDDTAIEDQEVVLETLSSILQMVMEHFQLLPEELTAKLNEFGMEMKDLLTEDGMKEFFLNMESVDCSDLLVNEELNQKLYTFMDDFLEMIEQGGLQEAELESVLQGIDVYRLLTEEAKLQEPATEKDFKQSKDLLDVPEEAEEAAGEPEVLISRQETKPVSNMEKQSDSQKEDASSQMTNQGVKPAKDTSMVRGENFQNPILQAINDAVNHIQQSVTVEEAVPENNVIKQIVEQVRVSMNQNSTSMELQLYPEHLGKIQIHVVSKDGVMTARIAAETEAARQAIEGGLSSLKDTLEQQNLKVEAIEVMVSTTGFEQQNEEKNSYQQKNDSKSSRKLDLSGMDDDIPQDDEAENLKMMAAGSSVSYTA